MASSRTQTVLFKLTSEVFCFSVLRRGAPGRSRAPHSLPGRRVSIRHHSHRLPDETHLDDHDGRLQVRQVPAAHHLAQPQLHGSAFRVRRRPEQRHHSSYTHAQTHRRRDCRIGSASERISTWNMLSRCHFRHPNPFGRGFGDLHEENEPFFAVPSCQCWAKHCAAVIRWLLAAGAG